MRLLTFFAFLALAVSPASAQDSNALGQAKPDAINLNAMLDSYVLPAMDRFQDEADKLPVAMQALCASPSEATLASARTAFSDVVLSFSAIEFIRVGAIMENNRSERILFWPDRKGIALRQVQAVLADKDETAADPTSLTGKSVAVQGLGALEFVLYGTGAETLINSEGNFRCRYGSAIGQNLSVLAGEVADAWWDADGITKRLLEPSAEYADYRTPLEALEAVVGLVSHGLEGIRDTRLLPYSATETAAAKPRLALFWRSNLTIPSLRTNVQSMQALLTSLNVGNALTEANAGLPDSIDFEFRNAYRALDLITGTTEEAVADPKQAQAMAYLAIVLKSLQSTVGENLSQALGLSVGFSSLDGD